MKVNDQSSPLPALLDSYASLLPQWSCSDGGGDNEPPTFDAATPPCLLPSWSPLESPWPLSFPLFSLSPLSLHQPHYHRAILGKGVGAETSTTAMVLCVMSPVTLWGGKWKGEGGW